MTDTRLNVVCDEQEVSSTTVAKMAEATEKIFGFLGCGSRKLNLRFTGEDETRRLNKEYADRDVATDILSWSYYADAKNLYGGNTELIGEIVFCLGICERQAEANGWDLDTELIRLLVHGVAHIVGFDHADEAGEREMEVFERKLLLHVGLDRVLN